MVVAQTAKQVDPDFLDRCCSRPLPIDETWSLFGDEWNWSEVGL